MRKFLHIAVALLLFVQYVSAQTAPPSHLSGEELKTWLRTNWYDGKRVVLDYGTARGKMYNYIDNYNNTVTCVYSGYQQSRTYSESSTSTANMLPINCEHTVPQSWFDEAERMRSDIHHLFPTYETWNSDRGSDPFAEIPDNQTLKWVRGTNSQSTIPISNIEEYSEDTNTHFEPREDHKGNVARAIFYFYTMHANQTFDPGKGVISAVADVNTLYQWHLQDPVDDRERERNRRTETVQGNRNPYIDYPDLVATAWGFTPVVCEATTQVSNLAVSNLTTTSLNLTWTSGNGNSRLVVIREGAAVDFSPSGTFTGVNANYTLAADQGQGHRLVHSSGGFGVTVTGLRANTTYYVKVFEYCASSEAYNTTNAPAITATTADYTCSGTPATASALSAGGITQTGFTLSWTSGSGDGRLVVIRKDAAGTFAPLNGNSYEGANANYTLATSLSDGSRLIYNGAGNNVAVTGLQAGETYYVQVFESCSNGQVYAVTGAPTYTITTTALLTGTGNLIIMQNFNGTANDGWVVTSGFSSSDVNTGLPNGQRLRSGASLQTSATAREVVFSDVDVTGKQDVYFELYNSSVSGSDGNGFDAGDYLEVYVALNGANFSPTPDIRITGNSSTNQIRYGMTGMATIATPAGTPVEKIFTESLTNGIVLADDKAPSKLQITIPNGTSLVKVKLSIKTNATNEIWNVDDVGLYSATTTALPEYAAKVGITVAPNPTTGKAVLQTQKPLNKVQLSVINALGKVVHGQYIDTVAHQHVLDLSHLPAGLYFVHIKTDKLQAVQRLVVVK